MKVSRKGVAFVAGWEGFSSCPYRDAVGVWTIGYGETNGIAAHTRCISKRKARRQLRRRLNRDYLDPVRALPVKLRQCEVDALASAVYNLGPGLLEPDFSTLARRLRANEAKTHAGRQRIYRQELPRWDRAGGYPLPGLTARRRAEVRLANHANYSGRP